MFRIVSDMSRERGLDPRDVRGPKRHAEFVRARIAISKRLRAMGCSYPEIGRALGGRDHTSAMYYLGVLGRQAKKAPHAEVAVVGLQP